MRLLRLDTFTPLQVGNITGTIFWKTPRELYNKTVDPVEWKYYKGIENYSNPTIDNPPIGYTFKPDAPFDSYTRGAITTHEGYNRRSIILSGSRIKKAQIFLYARYLYQVKLFRESGTLIPNGYEVDHINNDCVDDREENLQMLTRQENKDKWLAQKGKVLIVAVCPICKSKFSRPPAETQCNPFRSDRVSCCSKECQNIIQTLHDRYPFKETAKWLNENQMIYVIRVFSNDKYVIPVTEIVATWYNKAMLSSTWKLKDDLGNDIDFKDLRVAPVEQKIKFINECLSRGLSLREIGRQMGLPHGTVKRILDRIEGNDNCYHEMVREKIARIQEYLIYGNTLLDMAVKENTTTRTLGLFISANKDLVYVDGVPRLKNIEIS